MSRFISRLIHVHVVGRGEVSSSTATTKKRSHIWNIDMETCYVAKLSGL